MREVTLPPFPIHPSLFLPSLLFISCKDKEKIHYWRCLRRKISKFYFIKCKYYIPVSWEARNHGHIKSRNALRNHTSSPFQKDVVHLTNSINHNMNTRSHKSAFIHNWRWQTLRSKPTSVMKPHLHLLCQLPLKTCKYLRLSLSSFSSSQFM